MANATPSSAPQTAKGKQTDGANWWAAMDTNERTPELVWPRNIEVFDLMRRTDPQVLSVLRAVTLPIRRTTWRIDPNGARPEVTKLVAEDLGLPIRGGDEQPRHLNRTRDRFDFNEHLRLALLKLVFGHSFFEQVYRIETTSSGAQRARLRKLLWLPPRTLSEIGVEDDGGLAYVRQPHMRNGEKITVDALVAHVSDREGGNWLGQSLLRPAYKFWILKDRLLRVQAQSVDRNGMGVPVYTDKDHGTDPSLTTEERQKREADGIEAGTALAQAFRSGDAAGAGLPNGATLTLKGVDGKLPDAMSPIRYYDDQIARAVLAHFLNLGGDDSTGSYALGDTFADFFTLSLQTVAMEIATTTSQHVIEDLVDHNWGPDEKAPLLVFDEIGSRHPVTGEAIRALVECGALTPTDELEAHLRTIYGLPPLAQEDTRAENPPPAAPAAPPAAPEPDPGTETGDGDADAAAAA